MLLLINEVLAYYTTHARQVGSGIVTSRQKKKGLYQAFLLFEVMLSYVVCFFNLKTTKGWKGFVKIHILNPSSLRSGSWTTGNKKFDYRQHKVHSLLTGQTSYYLQSEFHLCNKFPFHSHCLPFHQLFILLLCSNARLTHITWQDIHYYEFKFESVRYVSA